MKIRCISDSIRLRLRKSDIDILQRDGSVQESISFPNQQSFGFRLDADKAEWGIDWEGTTLHISVPADLCQAWIHSENVSLRKNLKTSSPKELTILIEKDFPCKHTGSDYEDTFYELQPEEFKMKKSRT